MTNIGRNCIEWKPIAKNSILRYITGPPVQVGHLPHDLANMSIE
jgi:hypothetical protein